jgi:SRSO17 transposase
MAIERLYSHPLHQRFDMPTAASASLGSQQVAQHPTPGEGKLQMQLVDPPHEREVCGRHRSRQIAFATKPALAVKMISQALAANVPFSWVAADSVYGVGDIEMTLRHAGKGYVLGVSANRHFGSWRGKPPVAGAAEEIAQGLASSAWRRLSFGGRRHERRKARRLGLLRVGRSRRRRI